MIGILTLGPQEVTRYLAIVPIQGKEWAKSVLVYKLTVWWLILNWWVSMDGYALCDITSFNEKTKKVTWNTKQYRPLTPELIKRLQDDGQLPNPMPIYKKKFGDTFMMWFSYGLIGIPLILVLLGR